MSSHLKVNEHCQEAYRKANRMLGLVKRTIEHRDPLKKLKLWTLEERRNRANLIELYKMSCGTASVPFQNFFTLAPQHVPTCGHSWKLIKPHSSTDARRFFFSVRVINKWNSLPQEAVDASSVNMFKNQAGQDPEQQDGFLYGLIVCVTLHGCTTL